MATYSSILAWEIPWTEEPGGLQSVGSQKSRRDGACSHTPREQRQEEMLTWGWVGGRVDILEKVKSKLRPEHGFFCYNIKGTT